MLENRTWAKVGGPGFGPAMPVLRDLAARCAYYDQWEETNASQSSLTQYIGLTSGVDNTHTVNDCAPSRTCASSDDNIFRAVRQHGGTARSFVEDTVTVCSSGSNAARHIPALYYRGSYTDLAGNHTDADFCATEVQPLSDLDVDALPTFAFVTPNLCHDGHDCANDVVDDWLRDMLTALVGGADYHAGTTAIFVLWDEDGPTPNLLIAPSAQPGPRPGVGSHAAALKTMMLMLGLTPLPAVAAAPDLRPATPL